MWIDAHNHLHAVLGHGNADSVLAELQATGIAASLVNATQPSDWPAVAELASRHSWVIPAFGIHPWHAERWSPDVCSRLQQLLRGHIGEIGLDACAPDLRRQRAVFREQLALAHRHGLCASIHCVRAWGPLLEDLSAHPLPPFILHGYSGSVEMVKPFAALGARFSFAGSFLHARRSKVRDTFRQIPQDRLLVETDSPHSPLPSELASHKMEDAKWNHPANIIAVYRGLSALLETRVETLAAQIADNFAKLLR